MTSLSASTASFCHTQVPCLQICTLKNRNDGLLGELKISPSCLSVLSRSLKHFLSTVFKEASLRDIREKNHTVSMSAWQFLGMALARLTHGGHHRSSKTPSCLPFGLQLVAFLNAGCPVSPAYFIVKRISGNMKQIGRQKLCPMFSFLSSPV